ncbi:MAG: lyase family protein, partial [Rhodothermales bacterium]
MIARYTRPEMAELWSEEAQFDAWLEVEIAAAAAWSKLGVIPAGDVEKIREKASFDVARIHEIEETTRHDVVAFTRAVSESLGEERKWVHYGLTSSDVVDTAWAVRLKKANALILKEIDRMIEVLARRANEHRHTLMMGRTHGIHAEPTTLGAKFALYYDEMRRNRKRFIDAAEGMRVGKVSGSVG